MEKKLTIEELEKQCREAEKIFKALHDQLKEAKKKEEEERLAKLAAEKDSRYKEVVDAYDNFEELRNKYVDDYGSFTFEKSHNNVPHWLNMFSI
jgi:molecular chaperone GrpE (heat shock protein)